MKTAQVHKSGSRHALVGHADIRFLTACGRRASWDVYETDSPRLVLTCKNCRSRFGLPVETPVNAGAE